MELRERKFVNYTLSTVRIRRTPSCQPIKTRKRAVSERFDKKSTDGSQKKVPEVKRRATVTGVRSEKISETVQSIDPEKLIETPKSRKKNSTNHRTTGSSSSKLGSTCNRSHSKSKKPIKIECVEDVQVDNLPPSFSTQEYESSGFPNMATNRVMTRSLSRSLNFMQSATTVAVVSDDVLDPAKNSIPKIHHITLSVQETPSDVEPLQNVSDQKPKRPKQARSRNEVPRKPSTEANGNASLQNSLPSKRTRSKIKVEVESKPILSNQQLQATIVSQEPNIIAPIGNRKRPASKVVKKKNARTRNTVPKKRKEVCESEEEDEFLNSENESDIDETSDEDDSSSITKRKRYSIDDSENDDDDDSDGEFFNQKIRALIAPPVSHPPRQFYEMQRIWSEISSRLTDDMLSSYKRTLLRLIVGRSSCLHPIRRLMPNLPADLFGAHERLYNLLCDASGAYPFKYHKGSTLISRHSLADTSQIGAQIMIECLDKKIVPFDILNEMPVLSRIETYVRIGIKDMLEEIVEQLPPDRNNITVADLKESLSSRLLG